MNALDAARDYTRRGWCVVPVPRGSKRPVLPRWQELRLTEKDLPQHFANGSNVGILLGLPSRGLVDADLDCAEAVALADTILPHTPMRSGRTHRPGSHRWYITTGTVSETRKYRDPVRTQGEKDTLCELRCTGGQTVVAPSLHPDGTGETYLWEGDLTPQEIDGAELTRAVSRLAAASLLTRYWPDKPGIRHDLSNALAGALLRHGWNEQDASAFIRAVAHAAGDEQATDRAGDAVSTARTLARDGKATGLPTLARLIDKRIVEKLAAWLDLRPAGEPAPRFHLTDGGNADRFIYDHGARLRYVHAWGTWIFWNGKYWEKDETGEILRLARRTARGMLADASSILDDEERKRTAQHALRTESETKLQAMTSLASVDATVAIRPSELDADPWLLTVGNGTIDLRTCELREHRAEDLITKALPIDYDMNAQCPMWESFLTRVLTNDRDLVDFMRRAVGYSLTGNTKDQVFFILHGSGANGKTTFLETLHALLGDLAGHARFETFLLKRHDTIPNDVARLCGKRFVSASEADGERRLAEGTIKAMSGSDRLTARFLHREYFDFTPTHKIWLSTNHRPIIRGTDLAIWRRVRLIPFSVTIPESERDADLLDKLKAELPGILTWAVAGCWLWKQDGLGQASAVSTATADYRREMDSLADFLDEHCILEPDAWTASSALYEKYKAWAATAGEDALPMNKLGKRLTERPEGLTTAKRQRSRGWLGIRLKSPADLADERDGGA